VKSSKAKGAELVENRGAARLYFEKTKPIAGLRPEIRSTKLEIRNNGI
jgi:hypothetical protein